MLTKRMLLIPAMLMLVTGYTAPCIAQVPEPVVVEAMTKVMARNLIANPTCVREQVGRPFVQLPTELIGGLDHWVPACDSQAMNWWQVWSHSSCSDVPERWVQADDAPWEPWGGIVWATDGTVREVWVVGGLRATGPWLEGIGIAVGQWGSHEGYGFVLPPRVEGTPTWAEFVAGTPVVATIDWLHANDWIIIGSEYSDLPHFTEVYGFDPRDAMLTVTVEYLGDVEPMVWDPNELLGSRIGVRVDVAEKIDKADYNRDNVVDVVDVVTFLNAWFSGDARAASCERCAGCAICRPSPRWWPPRRFCWKDRVGR